MKVCQRLATLIRAMIECEKSGNVEWYKHHSAKLHSLVETAPHGSGLDGTTKIDLTKMDPEKLLFYVGFHHMQEGFYTHWTEHSVRVVASLQFGIDVAVGGRNDNDVKDYIRDVFTTWLESECEWCSDGSEAHWIIGGQSNEARNKSSN